MTEHEKVHYLTEAIFKNVLDNFNPGVKQLIVSGRSLQKALHNVATQAKAYVECIYTLAQSAQVCKGATSEIGAALLQIAEVHKEINTQVIDNIKSFHSDLLIPLETKQENEFRHLHLIHKKYSTGHKFHQSAYIKSQSVLRKHKKKSKAKYGFDQKELQYAREAKDNFQKLEEYQFQNLRLALSEERKRYCFLLDRVCAMVRNYASHHSKAHELFTHRLSEWSELHKSPHILPESSEQIINAFRNQDDLYSTTEEVQEFERRTSIDYENRQLSNISQGVEDSSSFTYGTSHRLQTTRGSGEGVVVANPYPTMTNGVTQDDYAVTGIHRGIAVSSDQGRQQVRALYTHSGVGETQLSFVTGDIVNLIGEKRDGWQYGENSRTNRMGWFPMSFTEPAHGSHHHQDFSRLTTQRVKSLGNLADFQENQDYHMGVHSSGHSDSDSANLRMRERRPGYPLNGRPVSLHGGVLQLPTQFRLQLDGKQQTREADRSSSPWNNGGSFNQRHSFHPRQPSIPENETSFTASERSITPDNNSSSPINPFGNFVPKRHTLAYACNPVSEIYQGRRNSTIELCTAGIRSNSLLPMNRLSDRLKDGGIGLRSSLSIPADSLGSMSKIQEAPCIPPPEEFRDVELERSDSEISTLVRKEDDTEMTSVRQTQPSPEPPLPPPPPPLPPPNHPPPSTGIHGNYSTHPPLIHAASSPAMVRQSSGHHLKRPEEQNPHNNHYSGSVSAHPANTHQSRQNTASQTYPQGMILNSQSRPRSTFNDPLNQNTHTQRLQTQLSNQSSVHNSQRLNPSGMTNPDYVSRSEIGHMLATTAPNYGSGTPSPANSSSGYSSGTNRGGSTASYPQATHAGSVDLPPPPPPHVQTPSHLTPPPPPVPPPNPVRHHLGHNIRTVPKIPPRVYDTQHKPQYF